MAEANLFRGPLTEQYRPQTWADVVGQDKIVHRIQALAKRGLAGRAYWISGQSGTGKTTIARLIAAEVADEFCIEEVDAASLTVSQLRELEREMNVMGWGKGGRAYLVNERTRCARTLSGKCSFSWNASPRTSSSSSPRRVEGQESLFEDFDDASPLLSRCLRLDLAARLGETVRRTREGDCRKGRLGRSTAEALRQADANPSQQSPRRSHGNRERRNAVTPTARAPSAGVLLPLFPLRFQLLSPLFLEVRRARIERANPARGADSRRIRSIADELSRDHCRVRGEGHSRNRHSTARERLHLSRLARTRPASAPRRTRRQGGDVLSKRNARATARKATATRRSTRRAGAVPGRRPSSTSPKPIRLRLDRRRRSRAPRRSRRPL